MVLAEAAGMVLLAVATVRNAIVRPITWPKDFVEQAAILVTRCSLPLALSTFAFGFGTIGVQGGAVLGALGAPDRAGGVYVTASVREVAAWVTAMLVAGVGGTAICADLGARKIREELDALQVIGVNPIRSLVVPRVVALTVMTPLLFLFAVLICLLSGVAAVLAIYKIPVASFAADFTSNFGTAELLGAALKTTVFGVIIALVCCYKGLTASGGPQGVGRAVNQAVVISFVALWVVNYLFTSVLLASFPSLQELR